MLKNKTIFLVIVNNSCQNTIFAEGNTKNANSEIIKNIAEKLKAPSAYEKIFKPASEKVRNDRAVCYSSLLYLTNLLFGTMPNIDFKKEKPEFLMAENEEKICFNLSHSGDACAIALAAGCEIGVDVQQLLCEKTAANIEKRYLIDKHHILDGEKCKGHFISDILIKNYPEFSKDNFEKSREFREIKLMHFDLSEGTLNELFTICDCYQEIYCIAEPQSKNTDSQFKLLPIQKNDEDVAKSATRRWSVLESILKCDGSGFSGITNLEDKAKRASTYQMFFELSDHVYSVSVTAR